jgi:NitT/TauT family transport system substrate-binding protein
MKRAGYRLCRGALLIAASLLLWTLLPAAPVFAAGTALKKATFMPMWSPQAQFAGYYIALDKGIYAKHGIDLAILRAGPGVSPVKALADKSVDFAAIWLTTALRHRAEGMKLVNIAQIVQRSAMMLISKKSSGINSIDGMKGKKVGMWGGDLSIPPHTLFRKKRLDVHEIPLAHTVNLFLRGGIDVTSAMWYNEYHAILNSGYDPEELNVFFLHDQGMNFPEDGIYALEKTVRGDPALAKAFAAASLEGWRYAFAHPEEALDIVIRYMQDAQLPTTRVHQRWMLDRMRDLMAAGPGQTVVGVLREKDYEAVGSSMCKYGILKSYPRYSVFTGGGDAEK